MEEYAMTTPEIVRLYKESKDKRKQISILSDLNACTEREIKDILINGGIDARTLPRQRKKEEAPAVHDETPAAPSPPPAQARCAAMGGCARLQRYAARGAGQTYV